jgi:acetylornithine aminotransferase
VSFVRGRGCYLYDENGRRFLDFTAGIAVNALGHADDGVTKALTIQASNLLHISNLYHSPNPHSLANALCALIQNQNQWKDHKVIYY